MQLKSKFIRLGHITIFNYRVSVVALLWFLAAAIALIVQIGRPDSPFNNYIIFEHVFHHTLQQKNLYLEYPAEYNDHNYYGPVFSMVIAPFALLPTKLGCFFWGMANAALLFFAIIKLPLSDSKKNLVLLICITEMIGAIQNLQSNPMVAAWMILALIFVQKEKDFWATLFIALGFLVKIYGIVGLAFFFLSKHKLKFAVSFLFWVIVLICLPMLISSPSFILQSYQDWFAAIVYKNNLNSNSDMQNMSVMRVFKNILRINLPNYYYLLMAAIMAFVPILRRRFWFNNAYGILYLSLLLITMVIFSSSAEGATYIIAMAGVGIWFILQNKPTGWAMWLLIFTIVFGSLSMGFLFPDYFIKNYFRPFGIKAVPYFILWIVICSQLLFSPHLLKKISYAKKDCNHSAGL